MIFGNFVRSLGRRAGVLALVGWFTVGPCRADDPIPQAISASKYAKMAAHSPFAPPTAVVAPVAAPTPPPPPGWADNLSVSMIMQDGPKYMVTVIDSSNPQQHLYLTSEPDPSNQMSVVSVKWGVDREDPPTITLRKGREFAQVKYESGASTPGGNAPLGGPAIPGGARNLVPGASGIRPPPLPNTAAVGNPGGLPGNALRRPMIRSQPGPAAAPALVRPLANQPNAGVRPKPGAKADDDDDDDD